MERTIELYPVQHDFFTDDSPYTGFIAGIGSGKTFVGSLKALYKALPGTLGMVCAPTYGMLRDSTLRTFKELAGGAIVDWKKSEMTTVLRGGGEILWRSADDPDKLRGPNLNWAWIDEGGLTHPETWKIIIGRLRAGGKFGECWTTSTPKGRRNWLYEQAGAMAMYKATTLDNPFTSEDWKKSLLATYTGEFLSQEVYGEFVSFEGLVYPMFDRTKHVIRIDEKKVIDVGLAVDEGYTNPAVILEIQTLRDGKYHVKREWYERGKLQSEVVDMVISMSGSWRPEVAVDSSAAGLIADLRDKGVRAVPRKGSILEGIRYVQELLSKGLLTVDPSCVNLISEFESYKWKENKDEPVKEYDHGLDAVRYYLPKPRIKLEATQVRY